VYPPEMDHLENHIARRMWLRRMMPGWSMRRSKLGMMTTMMSMVAGYGDHYICIYKDGNKDYIFVAHLFIN
jgi:hypothetical protein